MFFTHHSIKNNLNPCIKTEPVTNGVDAVICVCLVTSPIAVTGSGFSAGALRLRLGQCILPIAFHRKLSSLTQLTVLQHNINSSIDSFTLKLKFLIGFISKFSLFSIYIFCDFCRLSVTDNFWAQFLTFFPFHLHVFETCHLSIYFFSWLVFSAVYLSFFIIFQTRLLSLPRCFCFLFSPMSLF